MDGIESQNNKSESSAPDISSKLFDDTPFSITYGVNSFDSENNPGAGAGNGNETDTAGKKEYAKEPSPGLYIVCDDNTCTPFSTKESGESNPTKFLEDNFNQFDRDRDGTVSKAELDNIASKFRPESSARKMTDALSKSYEQIHELSNDLMFRDDGGISTKDITKLSQIMDKTPDKLSAVERKLVDSLNVKDQKKDRSKEAESKESQEKELADKAEEALEKMARGKVFDGSEYDKALELSEQTGRDVVMKFGADWCGPCRQMDNDTWGDKDVKKHMEDNNIFMKINTDKNPELAQKWGVSSLPTTLIGKVSKTPDGKYEFTTNQRIVGYMNGKNMLSNLPKRK